jgi:hypothetical protein
MLALKLSIMKVGDLIQVREEIPFGPLVGNIGIVEFTEVQSVCIKGGLIDQTPEDGGPVYADEKCIMAIFANKSYRVSTFYDRYDIMGRAQ